MNPDRVNKIVEWMKKNSKYTADELKKTALLGGANEFDVDEALKIITCMPHSLEYAGVLTRFLAVCMDYLFLGMVYLFFIGNFKTTYIGGCSSDLRFGSSGKVIFDQEVFYGLCGMDAFLFFFTIFIYYVLLEWKFGGTFGKMILGIRIIETSGEQLSFISSLVRNTYRIIDFFPFFYLLGAVSIWNSKIYQRIGDKLANSIVVYERSIK